MNKIHLLLHRWWKWC